MQTLTYNFHSNAVRIVMRDGEPWFIASDICAALNHSNVSQVINRLYEDEKGIQTVDTLGGEQSTLIISESGLYSLILTSRKPEAKAFKRWVTHEVLPSIRRTGSYEVESVSRRRGSWLPDFIDFCDENSIDIGEALRAMRAQIIAKREVFQALGHG